jgi:hypothetical protein
VHGAEVEELIDEECDGVLGVRFAVLLGEEGLEGHGELAELLGFKPGLGVDGGAEEAEAAVRGLLKAGEELDVEGLLEGVKGVWR